ncbi:MAG: hypothetical protein ACJAUD_001482 [Crocinitomicaceae bacterium]|jgi:hypothetical protein
MRICTRISKKIVQHLRKKGLELEKHRSIIFPTELHFISSSTQLSLSSN